MRAHLGHRMPVEAVLHGAVVERRWMRVGRRRRRVQILDDLHQAAAMLVQRLVKALVPSSIHRALFGQHATVWH